MKTRIGADIDSVVCDLMPPLLDRINEKYGSKLIKSDITEWFWRFEYKGRIIDGAHEIEEALSDDDFVANLPVGTDSKYYLSKILDYDNMEVVFITSRLETHKEATDKWIRKHFGKQKVYYTSGNKNGYKVDVLIDDAPHHIESFGGKLAILFDQPWNKTTELSNNHTVRASDWFGVFRILKTEGIIYG